MTPHEANELFAYNDWANARLMACAAEFPLAAWNSDLGGAFPTMLLLAAHIAGAERVWLMRWMGKGPPARPAWATAPTLELLRAAMDDVVRDRTGFLASLTGEDIARPIRCTLFDGSEVTLPLETLIRHTANHSTYHRCQLAKMLRRLGAAPPSTDLLLFARGRA